MFTITTDTGKIDICISIAEYYADVNCFDDNTLPTASSLNIGLTSEEIINDSFEYYLRLKYKYLLSIGNGENEDEFFNLFDNIDTDIKEKHKKIIFRWSPEFITKEAVILLLRYNQLGQHAIKQWYSDLNEFNEWKDFVINTNSCYIKELPPFMGKHDTRNLKDIDNSKFNEVSSKIMQEYIKLFSNNETDRKLYIKAFLDSIVKVFNVVVVDYLNVKNDYLEFLSVSDINSNTEDFLLDGKNQSYKKGEGITGSALLGDIEEKELFHVGTNYLPNDYRQAGSQSNDYSSAYGVELKSFWVFPLWNNEGAIYAVFRVFNQYNDNDGLSYLERATLLKIARWFEHIWIEINSRILEIKDAEHSFSDNNVEQIYNNIPFRNEIDKKIFEQIISHLKKVNYRKIEKHSMGACFVICKADYIEQCKAKYDEFHVNTKLFNSTKIIKFDEKLSLEIGLLYKTIHPFAAFFLFSSTGEFHGVYNLIRSHTESLSTKTIAELTNEKAVAFLTQGGTESIRIFSERSLLADYYLSGGDGDWRFRLLSDVKKCISFTKINGNTLIDYICNFIFELSFNRIGALLVFSKNEFKSNDSQDHNTLKNAYFTDINIETLKTWASVDGAVISFLDGKIQRYGQLLPFNEKTKLLEYMTGLIKSHQKGSRHTGAAKYSLEHPEDCIIIVSENRGISILYKEYGDHPLMWDDEINNSLKK